MKYLVHLLYHMPLSLFRDVGLSMSKSLVYRFLEGTFVLVLAHGIWIYVCYYTNMFQYDCI